MFRTIFNFKLYKAEANRTKVVNDGKCKLEIIELVL